MVVPDYQLSLAIGKEGQNARLAARLTGYKIDIKSETQAKDAPGFRYEDYMDEDYGEESYEDDENVVYEEGEYGEDVEEGYTGEENGPAEGGYQQEDGYLETGIYPEDSGYEQAGTYPEEGYPQTGDGTEAYGNGTEDAQAAYADSQL